MSKNDNSKTNARKHFQEKGPKRNTHSQNAGLEDATATAFEILDEITRMLLYIASKTKKLIAILKVMRSGPHAYDKNSHYDTDKDEDKYKNL